MTTHLYLYRGKKVVVIIKQRIEEDMYTVAVVDIEHWAIQSKVNQAEFSIVEFAEFLSNPEGILILIVGM